jgi:streptogramin lyase
LGDLALARDGTVYLPDSGGPMVWRLSPGAGALELVAESAEFLSLQGAVVASDGSALFLADQANGLWRLDLNSNAVHRLESPPQTTLVGIDGLVRAGNGDLIAIQSWSRPSRVLRLVLAPGGEAIAAVTVLEAAHLTMAAPALGCLGPGENLFFVGHAGWSNFDGAGASSTRPRPVPVFRTKR